MDELRDFAYFLRNERLCLGMTQAQLAEKSGVNQEMISRLENGVLKPRLSDSLDLICALGLDLEIKK